MWVGRICLPVELVQGPSGGASICDYWRAGGLVTGGLCTLRSARWLPRPLVGPFIACIKVHLSPCLCVWSLLIVGPGVSRGMAMGFGSLAGTTLGVGDETFRNPFAHTAIAKTALAYGCVLSSCQSMASFLESVRSGRG